MIEDSQSVRCKYFNTWYCKFEDECSYKHPKEVCLLHLCQDKTCIKRHPKACRFKAHRRRRSSCMYRHNKYESVNTEEEIDRLKEEIVMLQKSNTEKINLLRNIEELKTQNENLKQTEVNNAQKYVVNKKEILEYHKKELKKLKSENEELKKKVASSDSLNVALAKKNDELVQEVYNIVNKANDQKGRIKIEYDKLVKIIAEKDNSIKLQEQQIQEQKILKL